jgi:hypothetical protein
MKTTLKQPSLLAVLAAAVLTPALLPSSALAADQLVELPAYQVTAPRFSSPAAEFMEKMDTLFDSPWIDAQGGPLIQDIIWRHAYLAEHPSDEALIYVNRSAEGRVVNATTVYTKNGALYANSYALGSNVKLRGLTAADLHDTAKVVQAIEGISDVYRLDASLANAEFRGLGDLNFIRGENRDFIRGESRERQNFQHFVTTYQPVGGVFALAGGGYGSPHARDLYAFAEFAGDSGQVVPYGLNPFYPGFMDSGWSDRYHEPATEMLDTVYRAMHDPNRAGLIPVAVSPVSSQVRTRRGPGLRSIPALVFDWDGVHYVYRPYHGTIGHPIPLNPVTGLPYLCVKDGGLIESIYFSATYLKSHPAEKAVVVQSDNPSAAYTVNGKLCLFSPSLNQFVLLKSSGPEAIGDQTLLNSSIARAKAFLAARPAPAAAAGPRRSGRLPDQLLGDTPDSQMRRIFVAFLQAGIPVHLNSGDTSSLTFTWQGVNYVYGADQQLKQNSSG